MRKPPPIGIRFQKQELPYAEPPLIAYFVVGLLLVMCLLELHAPLLGRM